MSFFDDGGGEADPALVFVGKHLAKAILARREPLDRSTISQVQRYLDTPDGRAGRPFLPVYRETREFRRLMWGLVGDYVVSLGFDWLTPPGGIRVEIRHVGEDGSVTKRVVQIPGGATHWVFEGRDEWVRLDSRTRWRFVCNDATELENLPKHVYFTIAIE